MAFIQNVPRGTISQPGQPIDIFGTLGQGFQQGQQLRQRADGSYVDPEAIQRAQQLLALQIQQQHLASLPSQIALNEARAKDIESEIAGREQDRLIGFSPTERKALTLQSLNPASGIQQVPGSIEPGLGFVASPSAISPQTQSEVESGALQLPAPRTPVAPGFAFNPESQQAGIQQTIENEKAKKEKTVFQTPQGIIKEDASGGFTNVFPLTPTSHFTQQAVVNVNDPNDVKFAIPDVSGSPPEGYKFLKGAESTASSLTQDAIDSAAQRYNLDHTLPSFGLGKANAPLKTAILNRAEELRKESGIDVGQQFSNQAGAKASQTELSNLQKQRGTILAFADTAQKNLNLVKDLSTKVGNTGVPVLNRWINAGKRSIQGDPDVSAFDAATQTAINEYAKITSSATGGGVTSDSARAHIESLLNTSQTPQQIANVIDLLNKEIDNRKVGYDNQISRIKSDLMGKKNSSPQVQSTSSVPSASQPLVSEVISIKTKSDFDALPSGSRYIGPSGKIAVKP